MTDKYTSHIPKKSNQPPLPQQGDHKAGEDPLNTEIRQLTGQNRKYFQQRASTLRKHAYSNIKIILPPKNENFQIKNSYIFHISAQNIDCGHSLEPPHRGGSNEYQQSMCLSRNKKNNIYPCKPQFYYIKVGFKGGQNYIGMFL